MAIDGGSARVEVGHSYLPLLGGRHRGRFILVESRRGAGKTRAILTHIVGRALRLPRSRWFLARSTRTLLTETVLATLEEQVLPLFGLRPPKGGRENRWDYKLPNGSVLIPVALDDPIRSQSAEYSGGYVAEVTDPLTQASDVLALAGAMRYASPGMDYYQCICDANPSAPTHWANQIAEPADDSLRIVESRADYTRLLAHNASPVGDQKWKRIITVPMDNPRYFDVANWGWTKYGKDYYDGLKHLAGHMRARWLHGLWVAAEGGVFPEFGGENIVAPFDIPDDWPKWTQTDPGYHNCAIALLTMSPWGCVYAMAGRIQGGEDIASHAAYLAELCKGYRIRKHYGDPNHMFHKTAQSLKTCADQFKEHEGIIMEPWPKLAGAAKEDGVEALRTLVVRRKFKVFSTFQQYIGEFRSWRYRTKTDGQMVTGDQIYEDKNNHLLDGGIGFIATKPKFKAGAGVALVGDGDYDGAILGDER